MKTIIDPVLQEKYVSLVENEMNMGFSAKEINKHLIEIIHRDVEQEEQEEGS